MTGDWPPDGDELAGVVDLFDALTRDELRSACDELAFRAGVDRDGEGADAGDAGDASDSGATGSARDPVENAIDRALAEYCLVAVSPAATEAVSPAADETASPASDEAPDAGADADESTEWSALLVVGPAAFPTLPEHAADLPHILDVPGRSVDRERAAEALVDRVRDDVAALTPADEERIATLREVTYDAEIWADVDLAPEREALDDLADGGGT